MIRSPRTWALMAVIVAGAMVGQACAAASTTAPTTAPVATAAPAAATAAAGSPAAAATMAATAPAASTSATGTCAPSQVKLVTSVRTLANPYQADWVNGAQMYASSVGLPLQTLQDNGDSQTQTALLRSLVANGGNCIVVNLDPNTDSDTLPQVKLLTDAGAWVVTQWSLPDNVYPWQVSDHWITSIAPDGRVSGYEVSLDLFKAMGGKGNIVALQGILDGLPEQQRFDGLQKALKENPGIHMLAYQTANWDTQTAYNLVQTWLTKYPGQINGIWSANDSMALGALEAIRAAGLYGKVPIVGTDAVPQVLQDISQKDNSIIATDDSGGYWQGGIGLALGYMAATGKLNVATMNQDLRLSYIKSTIITAANVASLMTPPALAQLKPDWDNPFNRFTGPVTFPAH